MSSPRPVSIASFTHLGYPKDLKSDPTYYSALSLSRAGMLEQLVVLDVEDAYEIPRDRVAVPVPGGKLVPRGLYLLDRLVPGAPFRARDAIIDLLDRFAARRVESGAVFTSFPGLYRTMAAARNEGLTTAAYAPSIHPDATAALAADEAAALGVDLDVGRNEAYVRSYDRADYVLCLSEYSKRTYVEAGHPEERALNVGPVGVDPGAYPATSPPDDEFVVVAVANMTGLKGTAHLLDAWERLDLPDAHLYLCGTMNGAIRPVLEPRIDGMDGVTHVGYVESPQEYYAEASVLVHPSLTEGGLSKVVMEAMASALPVVITEHSGAEYVDDAGFVVPIRDADAIADRLRYLYDHSREAREMGRRGREIVEGYHWEAFSDRVKSAHEVVLDREGHDG